MTTCIVLCTACAYHECDVHSGGSDTVIDLYKAEPSNFVGFIVLDSAASAL